MQFITPRLVKNKHNHYSLVFYVQGRRYRISNGQMLGIDLHPNKAPLDQRMLLAQELQLRVHQELHEGWGHQTTSEITFIQAVQLYHFKREFKPTYIKAFTSTKDRLESYLQSTRDGQLRINQITSKHCLRFLNSKSVTAASFNTERKHVSSLLGSVLKPLSLSNPVESIPKMKETPTLHKPFKDVTALLEDIKSFNENLFLCCLLTYGCLLRPHQEIRNLKWGDFSEDMKHISLSGKRNKSGRNRIVPLNPYILQYLHKGEDTDNIFTGTEKPFNKDYFKTLWSRYKAQSNVLEDLQTLYSFRHSGAIEIYKRTGSLTILQQAMGHASLAVTLGYLRGLEIPSLKIEDMPRL